MKKIIFTNPYLTEDKGREVNIYIEEEIFKGIKDFNLEELKLAGVLNNDKVAGFVFKDNMYVQVYKDEIIEVVE